MDHAYIWNNVQLGANVVISHSVVCDKAEVKEGVKLNKQCVLAYNVSSKYRRDCKYLPWDFCVSDFIMSTVGGHA